MGGYKKMQLIYVFIYTMLTMFLFTNKIKIKSIAMPLINVFIIVLTNYLLLCIIFLFLIFPKIYLIPLHWAICSFHYHLK